MQLGRGRAVGRRRNNARAEAVTYEMDALDAFYIAGELVDERPDAVLANGAGALLHLEVGGQIEEIRRRVGGPGNDVEESRRRARSGR